MQAWCTHVQAHKHVDMGTQNTASTKDVKIWEQNIYRYMNTSVHMFVCLPKFACRHLNALTQTQVQSKKDLKTGTQKTNTVTAPTVEQLGFTMQ